MLWFLKVTAGFQGRFCLGPFRENGSFFKKMFYYTYRTGYWNFRPRKISCPLITLPLYWQVYQDLAFVVLNEVILNIAILGLAASMINKKPETFNQ